MRSRYQREPPRPGAAEPRALYRAPGVALGTGTLTMTALDPQGIPYTSESTSTVVYLETDAGWRIAIDAPWGLPATP